MMEWIKNIVIEPIKKNLVFIFFFGGFIFILLGALIEHQGYSEFFLKSGSAILGGGVFAVLLYSDKFTKLFEKHIYNVFYDPEKISGVDELKKKLHGLSNAVLKHILPKSHSDATDLLMEKFFNSELEYHYENYEQTYDIKVNTQNNDITIMNTTRVKIVLAPKVESPRLKQRLMGDVTYKLIRLAFNAKKVETADFIKDKTNDKINILTIPLKEYAIIDSNNIDEVIQMERVVEMKQNLDVDSYVAAEVSRYTKGFSVKVKITDGYIVQFENFGIDKSSDEHHENDDDDEYERWTLAENGELLLPGQGYLFIITKKKVG